jgi:hypothetical protein
MAADTSALPTQFAATGAVNALTTGAARGGDGASVGTTVVIQNLNLSVAGNLDPTNPVTFRRTMVRIKDELRGLGQEYS